MVGKFIEKLIDKQFEMIGVEYRYKNIAEDGMVMIDKKKKNWYDVYKFKDCKQYEEWRKYILEQLKGNEKEANKLDFHYGMVYKHEKED